MMMRVTWLAVLFAVVLSADAQSARRTVDPVLLVIPSRYTVVEFALDITRMRSIYLVAYDKNENGDLVLYIWDEASSGWANIDFEDFRSGAVLSRSPAATFLVSQEGQAPAGITSGYENVRNVQSLNIKDIVNALHTELRFEPSEWKRLARRYGLKLEDRNAGRRRHGRYGPPGGKRQDSRQGQGVPMPEAEDLPEPEPVDVSSESSTVEAEPAVEEQPIDREKIATGVPAREKGVPLPEVEVSESIEDQREEAIAPDAQSQAGTEADSTRIEK